MTSSQSILKRIATDSSVALILNGFAIPLSYATTILIARYYGAEVMGTYFIALSLVGMFSGLSRLGLDTGLLRFSSAIKADRQAGNLKQLVWPAVSLVTVLGGVITLALLISGDFLSKHFHAPHLPQMLWFVASTVPIILVSRMVAETVRGLGGVKWVVFQEELFSPLIFLILLVGLVWVGQNSLNQAKALGFAYFLKTLLGLGLLAGCAWFIMRPQDLCEGNSSFQELFRYSWPIFLGSAFGTMSSHVDSLALGLFTSPHIVAYYGVAIKIAPIIIFPLLAINAVVPPLFSQFYQTGDLHLLEMVAQTSARWTYFLALPLALLIILLAPELLKFFGKDFAEARFALIVLAIGYLVNAASGSVGFILQMTGHQWQVVRARLIIGVTSFPVIAIMAATLGLNGVALATALAMAGMNILMVLAAWRSLKIKVFAQKIKWANFGALIGVCLFYITKPYLGPAGATAVFLLGFLSLVANSLKQEIHGILSHPQRLGVM
jgi:O-antigen/teichoic acid export membrane protein